MYQHVKKFLHKPFALNLGHWYLEIHSWISGSLLSIWLCKLLISSWICPSSKRQSHSAKKSEWSFSLHSRFSYGTFDIMSVKLSVKCWLHLKNLTLFPPFNIRSNILGFLLGFCWQCKRSTLVIMYCSRNCATNADATIKPIHYLGYPILKLKELVNCLQPWVRRRIETRFVAEIKVFASAFVQVQDIFGHLFQLILISIHISVSVFTFFMKPYNLYGIDYMV